MAILQKSCCGCCDVKTGSIVVAVIWIICTLLGVGYVIFIVATASVAGLVAPTGIILLIVYIVNFITHFLLIIGVVQESRRLILTWVIVTIIGTAVSFIVYIFDTILTMAQLRALATGGDNQLPQDVLKAAVAASLATIWAIWGVFFILTVYGCLVVFSHYQNLRDAALGQGQGQQEMVAMGNQPAIAGNQHYMMGNQPVVAGNQPYGYQPIVDPGNKQPATVVNL
ncbi:uncharacterized protein LOC144884550 [Branchiostoma floridae x Branchiostoma japonicum]